MNTMNHRGYTARIEYDERDNIFVGRILGIRAIISFHGETVSQLKSEFELAVDDYLLECEEKGTKPEKPASGRLLLRVPPEVHGRAMVVAQAAGKSLNQWVTEVLQRAVSWLYEEAHQCNALAAIGIASFGPIDLNPQSPRYGFIGSTPKPGWKDASVLELIRRAFPGIPITLDTDVNAAALAEHRWGNGVGLDDLVYITIGTGIGAGVISGGRLWQQGCHPEIGHMLLPRIPGDSFSGICPFHRNCWEGMCSGPALARRAGIPAEQIRAEWTGWDLVAQYIAHGLVNVAYVLSPERIIIGGSVPNAGELGSETLFKMIREKMSAALSGYAVPAAMATDPNSFIVRPALGDDAGICGALALAKQMLKTN